VQQLHQLTKAVAETAATIMETVAETAATIMETETTTIIK
jgi:hypothetical protein